MKNDPESRISDFYTSRPARAWKPPARAPLTDSRSSGQTPALAANAHSQKFLQTGPRSSAQLPARASLTTSRSSVQSPARAANTTQEILDGCIPRSSVQTSARADKPKSGQLDLVPKLNQPAPNLPNTTQDSK